MNARNWFGWLIASVSLMGLVGCAGAAEPEGPVTLVLMTHDSFFVSEATLEQFTAETGHTVELLPSGDAGAVVNQAVLAKDAPLADVLFGVDNTFLSRALENDIFIAYDSPALANVPAALQLDSENRALPVDYGDVCLNYDKGFFESAGIAPPDSLDDLIDPAYAGLTVVQNPATSSPGLAFLMATIETYGEDGYLAYWESMVANDVLVTSGWEDAYYGQFSAASDGDRPIVVSYASSPPAEVLFAETELSDAPTASVTAPDSCFRQIEFVGILNGTEHEAAAQQLVDFMLGTTFQEDIPLNMFVYPANSTAALPDAFVQYGPLSEDPATLTPELIAAERDNWIDAWTEVVLR